MRWGAGSFLLLFCCFIDSSTNREVEVSIDSFIDRFFWRYIVLTTDSHDNKLYKQQIVRIIVSPICRWLLRLASKEPEYAVFLSCLCSLRQPCPARLGEMNTTARILRIVVPPWKRKILRWRFFSPSAGLDLVRADRLPLYLCTIRNGIRDFACAFAYNAFGLTPPSDRLLANDCSW